jgi:Lrp/AsnC family leucine-responsive transcriptional regulator
MPPFSEKTAALDDIDREILSVLERDGRLSYTELANSVNLSANAAAERVRRLERAGVIAGYHAELDRTALGFPLQAYIDIKLRAEVPAERFERAAEAIAGIDRITLTTGGFDYTLRVSCRDQADLVRLVEALRAAVPIAETYSRLILRERSLGRSGRRTTGT